MPVCCKFVSWVCIVLNKLFNLCCDYTISSFVSFGECCKKSCCYCGGICDLLFLKLYLIVNLSKCTKEICNCWCYVFTRIVDWCDVCLGFFTPLFTFCGVICSCILVLVMSLAAVLLYLYLAVRSHKAESAVTTTTENVNEIATHKMIDTQAQYNNLEINYKDMDIEGYDSMKRKRHDPLDAFGFVMNLSQKTNSSMTLQPSRRSIDVSEPMTSNPNLTTSTQSTSEDSSTLNSRTTYLPEDTHVLGKFVKTVFTHAEQTKTIDTLGLCRSTYNTELPEFKPVLFPVEDSNEILKCLNDMLLAETHHRLCYKLDPELDAFLRWLILEGVPRTKEKCKGPKPVEDLLFPDTCTEEHNSTTCPHVVTTTTEEGIHW